MRKVLIAATLLALAECLTIIVNAQSCSGTLPDVTVIGEDKSKDCAGVSKGKAYFDSCNNCVGGTTGKTACAQDCAGKWGGTTVRNACGICMAPGTPPCTPPITDCAGVVGGTAKRDKCDSCVGGNTGKTACKDSTAPTKGYYMIGSNKYYDGDTIFLPKKNAPFLIKAYKNTDTLCGRTSIWTGASSVIDSATATVNTNVASVSMGAATIKITYPINAGTQGKLSCVVVVVDAFFSENVLQSFGYDPNSFKEYPTYDTLYGRPCPYKSVSTTMADKVFAQTIPAAAAPNVDFVKGATIASVSPTKGINGNDNLLITMAVANGQSTVNTSLSKYTATNTAKLNVLSYAPIQRTVGIIYVDEENDDVQAVPLGATAATAGTVCVRAGANKFLDSQVSPLDSVGTDIATGLPIIMAGRDKVCNTMANNTNIVAGTAPCGNAELKDSLNKIYKGANFVIADVATYPARHLAINYDLDRDGLLDGIVPFGIPSNPEIDSLKAHLADSIKRIGDSYNYYLVIVKKPKFTPGKTLYGRGAFEATPQAFRFTLVFSDSHIGLKRTYTNTCGHELGHSAFNLHHPFDHIHGEAASYFKGLDPDNFMDYQDGHKSRAYQWIYMQPQEKINKFGKLL